MSPLSRIAPAWRGVVDFVRPQDVPKELVVEAPTGGVRTYFLLCLLVAIAIVASSLMGLWPVVQVPQWQFILLLLGAVAISDYVAMPQRRSDNVLTVFSDMLVITAVATFGLHWSILAVLVVSECLRYGRILPMTGGRWGAAFNISCHLMECAVVACLVLLLQAHSLLTLAGVISIVVFAIALVTMSLCGIVAGEGLAAGRSTFDNELAYSVANLPFYTMALYTMSIQPYAALLGMLGPTALAFVSTRAQERLVDAERALGVDALTGIANRGHLGNELIRLREHALRTETGFAAIMLDIDNFKVLNDTHGHLAGDTALIACATAIERCAGPGRVAARYGGEEFAVLIETGSVDEAHAVAENLRIESRAALRPWGTTVSIGVVHFPANRLLRYGPETIMSIADAALYDSKSAGKDRVTVAGDQHIISVRQREAVADVTDLGGKRQGPRPDQGQDRRAA